VEDRLLGGFSGRRVTSAADQASGEEHRAGDECRADAQRF
jgi:hypothetical protein